jgi:tetratricopeptide (TPR) repeat protein
MATTAACTPALAPVASGAASPPPAFDAATRGAFAAFTAGNYAKAEREWREASTELPSEPLVWLNFGTCLVILASDEMTLGVKPQGRAAERLQEALSAFDAAERLGSSDALLLNSRGNALGLLQQWGEARAAYDASAAVSPRDFESIPRSNAALVSFEMGELQLAEREASKIIRRDPRFVDADALLAAVRWKQGDVGGAVRAFERLCEEPLFCQRYATADVVLGRWTPKAVDAYRQLLKEPGIKLALKDGGAGLR